MICKFLFFLIIFFFNYLSFSDEDLYLENSIGSIESVDNKKLKKSSEIHINSLVVSEEESEQEDSVQGEDLFISSELNKLNLNHPEKFKVITKREKENIHTAIINNNFVTKKKFNSPSQFDNNSVQLYKKMLQKKKQARNESELKRFIFYVIPSIIQPIFQYKSIISQ